MKYIYFIESNSAGNGVKAIEYAKSKGYRTYFLTSMPDKYTNMIKNPMNIADKYKIIDTNDIITLLHFFEDKDPLAILAFDDFHIIQAAVVGEYKNLIVPSITGLLNTRFKDKTREKLKETKHNIDYRVYNSYEEDNLEVNFPCVIKPVDESGSVGVQICRDKSELESSLHDVKKFSVNISGYKYVKKFLIEEYIEGQEYSAELVWDNDHSNWVLLGFTKKVLSPPPFRVEIGHLHPFHFSHDLSEKIKNSIKEWLSLVQISKCVVHVEFKLVRGSVKLIEINPRPAGDLINNLVELSTGKSLSAYYVDLVTGESQDNKVIINNTKTYYIHFILPPKTGVINQVIIPSDKFNTSLIEYYVKEGPIKVDGLKNSDDRIGYVIVSGNSEQEAIKNAELFIENLQFKYSHNGESVK